MKLSICMMVKNEEKNLHRCLKSLQKLREAVSSELIIVDTGSTDRTVDIAKEYTDKVYFHKWNKNFSDMRNKSISYAKAQWVMIIDADEELQDAHILIEFLKSKESEKFNTALLFVKNIAFKGTDYKSGVLKSPRLFRRDKDFRYEGAVHNQPMHEEPLIQLETMLVHYGYILDDKELMDKKFKRTTEILRNELDKEPENIYYQFQLGVSYGMHNEYSKALEEMEKAYKLVIKKGGDFKNHIYVLTELLSFYIANNKFFEAEKIGKDILNTDPNNLDAYFNLAKIQLHFGNFEEAEKNYESYFNILKKVKEEPEVTSLNNTYYSFTRASEAYMDIAKLYFNKKDYSKSLQCLSNIETIEIIKDNFNIIMDIFMNSQDYTEFVRFINNLPEDEKNIKDLFIMQLENNLSNIKKEQKHEIFKELLNIKDEDYRILNKIRLSFFAGENVENNIIDALNQINLNEKYNYYGDILYFAFKENLDMQDILSNITEKNIDEYFSYIKENYEDFNLILTRCVKNLNISNSFIGIRFSKILFRYILVWNKLQDEEYKTIFNEYVTSGVRYLESLYLQDILQNELIYDLKNSEEIFFLFMMKAFNFLENDKSKAISYLRKALQEAPIAKRGIELILKDIENQVGSGVSEFEQYKLQVKGTIKSLIASGDTESAKSIIGEYEKIVKDDVEIVLIKSEIALSELKGKAEVNSKVRM